jgi:uncharacterized protein (TIGR02285 family)
MPCYSLLSRWLRFTAIALIGLPSGVIAAELDTLTWCQFDLPPMYIVNGPNAGQGSVDGHVNFLIKKLPQYQHRNQFSNIARTQADIKAGLHLVCGGFQRNAERETYMLFSEPFLITLPPRIILPLSKLAQLKPWLNSDGELQLSKAIQKSGLMLGISSGRSYGRNIDDQLAALKGSSNILTRPTADDVGEGLVRMMMMGRLDMAIAFPSEERLYREVYSAPGDSLINLAIEGMPRYIPVYFVAPQNNWGRQFITRIDSLLRQYWSDPEFRRTAFFGHDAESRARSEAFLREIDPNRKR